MQAFEYANPTTLQEALGCSAMTGARADVLAGGTDLLSLMKDYLHTPKRVVNIKSIKELDGIRKTADGLRIGALVTIDELVEERRGPADYPSLAEAARWSPQPADPQHGNRGRRSLPAPALLVFPPGLRPAGQEGRPESWSRTARTATTPFSATGAGVFRQRFQPRSGAGGARREGEAGSAPGSRELPVAKFFVTPQSDSDAGDRAPAR